MGKWKLLTKVFLGDPRKPCIVVGNLRVRQNQGLVHKPTIHPNHSHLFTFVRKTSLLFLMHLGELEPGNCVAHFAVDSVHAKVAIGRIRLPVLKMAHFHHCLMCNDSKRFHSD